jgi:hypothetical protein
MRTLKLAVAALLFTASTTYAQIPQIIAYQGHVSIGDSSITSASLPISLTLYGSESGSDQVWNTQTNVQANKGYYTVLMDFSRNWQNGEKPFNKQYWLEVLVNGQRMIPRTPFTSTPYSFNSRKADTAAVALALLRDAPVGTISAYGGDISFLKDRESATGWALCDGRKIARADFQVYYDVVRDAYGRSDNGDSVYLPDFRGMFLRGVNMSRNDDFKDPDASSRVEQREGANTGNKVGSIQQDAFATHAHTLSRRPRGGSGPYAFAMEGAGDWVGAADPQVGTNYLGETRTEGGSNETRPVNAAVYWIIKVK